MKITLKIGDKVRKFDLSGQRAKESVRKAGENLCACAESLPETIEKAGKTLQKCRDTVKSEIAAVRERDPAAHDDMSDFEILTLYSGVHALLGYRVGHALLTRGHGFSARAISQATRLFTGIEIHPGAVIGKDLFIDHGSGVVIGETAVIGDRCTIYQGSTLGGTGKETGKRHPTLGDDVMIGAGSKVLGPVHIGSGSKIAAGAVVLTDIPENCTAVGIPARIVKRDNVRVEPDLDQIHIPDPVEKEFCALRAELRDLRRQLDALKPESNEEPEGQTKEQEE